MQFLKGRRETLFRRASGRISDLSLAIPLGVLYDQCMKRVVGTVAAWVGGMSRASVDGAAVAGRPGRAPGDGGTYAPMNRQRREKELPLGTRTMGRNLISMVMVVLLGSACGDSGEPGDHDAASGADGAIDAAMLFEIVVNEYVSASDASTFAYASVYNPWLGDGTWRWCAERRGRS